MNICIREVNVDQNWVDTGYALTPLEHWLRLSDGAMPSKGQKYEIEGDPRMGGSITSVKLAG